MGKLRLLVVALAIGLAVPVGLLVHRALRSVALERELRHRTVAERVFDEMERALSDVLQREEARAVDGWLEAEPPAPFVAGYFQVDPDGRVDVGARTGGAMPATAVLRQNAAPRARAAAPAAPAQKAGTTVGLEAEGRPHEMAQALKDERQPSAYDALSSLNQAVSQRAERLKSKEAAPPSVEKKLAKRQDADDESDAGASADAPLPSQEPSPMTGRALDADRLVLSRTVIRDARAYRQGMVVDLARLAAFLRERALGDAVLAAHATAAFTTPFAAAAGPAADFVYQHRFADPFDDVTARLALRTLPGGTDASYVYALSGGLLLAAVLGLLALYRMVAVAMAFAERRSNFVAAVSHELRTPLTAIRMYGEMLRDGIVPSEEKRQEYYGHITAESERLSRLVNNVLEFSRLEKGTRAVALATGPLEPVVREAVELVRPHVEAEGFTLRLELDDALPPVRFERDALLQVLFNLIDNAVKYAGDGAERRVVVRASNGEDGVRLTVSDAGPGVPGRHLAHVFEPFYRGEHELTRRTKGTGIGLALVRGLVERMGGRVNGRNAVGGGFEVAIVLAAAS
jgi:signal transduction histidine kinase